MAYDDAKAQGMSDKEARIYAASSVVCGDIAYDALKAGDTAYWNTANHMVDLMGGKKNSQALRNSLDALNNPNPIGDKKGSGDNKYHQQWHTNPGKVPISDTPLGYQGLLKPKSE